jgi:hypothetical protein
MIGDIYTRAYDIIKTLGHNYILTSLYFFVDIYLFFLTCPHYETRQGSLLL